MEYICNLLTSEPKGGSAMIPLRVFLNLYEYLANLDCNDERQYDIEKAEEPDLLSLHDVTSVSKSSSTIDSSACNCEFTAKKVYPVASIARFLPV